MCFGLVQRQQPCGDRTSVQAQSCPRGTACSHEGSRYRRLQRHDARAPRGVQPTWPLPANLLPRMGVRGGQSGSVLRKRGCMWDGLFGPSPTSALQVQMPELEGTSRQLPATSVCACAFAEEHTCVKGCHCLRVVPSAGLSLDLPGLDRSFRRVLTFRALRRLLGSSMPVAVRWA